MPKRGLEGNRRNLTHERQIPATHLLTGVHFTLFAALHRQNRNNHLSAIKSLVIVFPPYHYVQWGHKQGQLGFCFLTVSYFRPRLRQKSHLHFLGPVPPPNTHTHTHTHPQPLLASHAQSLVDKSLFNPRLDYNSEVIAWPSSSFPLSEGPPPNREEQHFINVLLTSLLQCNAGKGSPLGIVLMGRARMRPVKQITAKGQRTGLRKNWRDLPLVALHNGSQTVIMTISLITHLECWRQQHLLKKHFVIVLCIKGDLDWYTELFSVADIKMDLSKEL